MRKTLTVSVFVGLLVAFAAIWSAATAADAPDAKGKIFELRTYVTHPGKLEALHKRFREHTCALFKKHGIELIGFWTPAEGPEAENTLVYIVAFPSKEAQKKAWADFKADPVWQKAFKESHKDGVIVDKVIGQTILATDYSPIK
jgi:ABC-type xylose transport system permease subunit